MTWEQLRELKKSGLFDIQSHTYRHPNFNGKRKLTPAARQAGDGAVDQIEEETEQEVGTGGPAGLPWHLRRPIAAEGQGGYIGNFSIERRRHRQGKLVILPRYLP